MMRGAGGTLCVAIAALLVYCSADPHQDSDLNGAEHTGEHYDAGHKPGLDHQGGGNLVREVRETGHGLIPYLMSRRYEYASPYGSGAGGAASGKHDLWPVAEYGGYYDGLPKRNFDEIDRSGLNTFMKKRNFDEIDRSGLNTFINKRNFDEIDRSGLNTFMNKRNFDEIDQTSMPFPYAKRFYRPYSSNHYDIDMPVSSFDKKRFRADYPMDEIDLSHFPIGSKRSQDGLRALR